MNWYLDVIKNKYAVFSGRARRKEFWMFVLGNAVIVIALQILGGLFYGGDSGPSFLYTFIYILISIYGLAVLIPSLALEIRRLHDVGKSGWWLFIALIPLVGAIWLLVLFVTDSQPGTNQYGPNPKEIVQPVMQS